MLERGSVWMCPQVKNSIGYDIGGEGHQAIEGGQRQPENSQKSNMLADPVARRISHYQSRNFFSAPATKTLIHLQSGAAFIAKHSSSPNRRSPRQGTNYIA